MSEIMSSSTSKDIEVEKPLSLGNLFFGEEDGVFADVQF
jgi:hypothetical protein